MFEAIGRLIDPPEMNTDRLLLVSFLGLIVNLVGILVFNHGHHHGHSHGHGHRHDHNHNHVSYMDSHNGLHGHYHHNHGDNANMEGLLSF